MLKKHGIKVRIYPTAEQRRRIDKSEWYGRTLVKIPTFYPSSQTCSCCGAINREVKKLSVREWACPVCGVLHERDENAAINILKKGKGILLQSA